MEIWKRIKKYPNYSISNFGKIRREKSVTNTKKGKILKQGFDGRYMNVSLFNNGIGKTHDIHGLVAEYFINKRPNGKEINHKDGNKINNHVSNLEYVTKKENAQHCIMLGLRKPILGENSHHAKLREKDVYKIRELHSQGINQRIIAKMFNVCFQNIHYIISRKTWNHI